MTEYVTVWRDHEPTKLHWGIPVVRCRNCKHATDECYGCKHFSHYEHGASYRWEDVSADVDPDGFCAWGEPKEVDATRTELEPTRTEPLPCPFCGGHASVIEDAPYYKGQNWFGVGCANPDCVAYTGYGMRLFVNLDKAIAAWNRRAE